MKKTIAFLDVDGTFVYVQNNEYIPESAAEAVRRARANGHKVFLCTGRSKAEIYPHILEVGLDGVIGAAGGFIELGDQEIFHRTIDREAAIRLTTWLDEKGIDYYLECNDGLYASKNLIPHLAEIMGGYTNGHFIDSMKPDPDLTQIELNKISFLETKGILYQEVYDRFHEDFHMVRCTVSLFGEESGEISVKGISKSTSIRYLVDYLKENDPEFAGCEIRTLAIGDGMNDLDMLEHVDIGIAMGNAKSGLKEVADYVTSDILEDGVYRAFEKFGLLEE